MLVQSSDRRRKKHIPRIGCDEGGGGGTRQSTRTGKMWLQEEMEPSITDAAWPAFERE